MILIGLLALRHKCIMIYYVILHTFLYGDTCRLRSILHSTGPMPYVLSKNPRCNYFICRAWNNCSTNVHRQGCTLHDLIIQVLQYPDWSWIITYGLSWSWLNEYDVIKRHYAEVVDSLRHLCNSIEPGTNTRQSLYWLQWSRVCKYNNIELRTNTRHSVSTDYSEVMSVNTTA